MTPEPHPHPHCWRCQDWGEVLDRNGRPKPCPRPECEAKKKSKKSRTTR